MSHSSRTDYHTVQVVPLTAFDAEGRLDLAPMRKNTERLLDAGVRVFIPCAGSSEFHTLNVEEILACVQMTRQVVGDRAKVVVPVGQQLASAIQLAQRAVDVGADAMLIMPLGFPYLSDAGAEDYYLGLLENASCPAVIYKKDVIPSSDLLLRLADHSQLLGVKYSLPDPTEFYRIVQADAGRIDWFCGHAERYAPYFMLAGAPAYTSGAANVCPQLTLAMHAAFAANDFETGFAILDLIRPIEEFRARDSSSFNVSFLKSAMRHVGLDFGEPRPPYRRLTDQEHAEIERLLLPVLAAESAR